ncbi:gamma-glutamyltransferase [Defluviimonas sp. 20V17]|uniref:Gamma-glutamyltransferase n=1 Tax=Allgaiera indica TaxID=765699 RepID=A0AAN5A130_9RHOB|nr:gamma-glutamyltransferase family protein [Allgaiera indica]KDB05528.1 gamma-glutamyltransferase [Defluviimonas sp. 20V17]GHE03539.1 gamma-glutamyltransferase [Allgaiera indica]SDX43696.1 gamma-glutamyltransferase 2. Threonine peptidase. MEROPS family T03 [Allgaiera indica]
MRDYQLPGRSAVFAQNGLCATSHPLAAKVAVETLEAGGNAVDAAIAGAVLLGICEPQMTGIGGDCFVLLKPAGEERIVALNGSGRAPAGLSAAEMRGRGLTAVPPHGPEAVTVPGAVDAFCRLSQDWGKLGLSRVLAPAIRYADEGVPVAPRVAFDWAASAGVLQGDARDFYLLDGKAPAIGQTFRAPRQAEVLRKIAAEGRAGFYEGAVAEDMVASLRALGGSHTVEDFAATECSYGEPVRGTYRDIELVEHPPNGQGAAAILLLNILAQFDLASMDPFGAERAHIEAEAAKLAYDARNRFVADPAHMTRLDHMLSVETAQKLAALIDPKRAMADPAPLSEAVHRDTIYITVVDRDRMAVSLIYSVFHAFGSGLASSRYGINFQNRGAGFTLTEGHPNEAGPGKRPMHTIIPGMLCRDGKVMMPFGVMGGAYQANGHARFVTNLTDFGLDPQGAIDAPRSFAVGGEGMEVERGYSDAVRAKLAEMGHDVRIPSGPIGGAQAILIDPETGVLVGASDPRKDGCALGY